MPLTADQIEALAERIHADPSGNAARAVAQIRHWFATHPHYEDSYNVEVRESLQLNPLFSDPFSREIIRLDRDDLRALDSLARARAATDRIRAERLHRIRGPITTSTVFDDVTSNPVDAQIMAEIAAMTNTQTPFDRVLNDVERFYAETPNQETESLPMQLQIPHPAADFDHTTLFVFYAVRNSENPHINTVSEGRINASITLYDLAQDRMFSERALLSTITIPENLGSESVTFCSHAYMAGLPLAERLDAPQIDINLYELFTNDSYEKLMRWDHNSAMQNMHTQARHTRTASNDSFHVIGRTPRPVHEYYTGSHDPVTSPHEAWARCSESWQTWAKASPIDTRILIWHTVAMYPHYFGFYERSAIPAVWYNDDMLEGFHSRNGRSRAIISGVKYNPDNTITLYRSDKELESGKPATVRVGKAVRAILHDDTDSAVKDVTGRIIGAMTPPEFKIEFDKAGFDLAYTKGPSSCMTYDTCRYYMLEGQGPYIRPTDAFINGDIGVAMFVVDGRVTARSLIVESSKKWVRIYGADFSSDKNGSRALQRKLTEMGYTHDPRALHGQCLVKIPIDMPDTSNSAVEHFNYNPRELQTRLGNHFQAVTVAVVEAVKSTMELRAYAAPFIDSDNPFLIEFDDYLMVDHGVYENWTSNITTNLALARTRPLERGGRTQYQCGGLITMNYDEVLAAINEATVEQPEQNDLFVGVDLGAESNESTSLTRFRNDINDQIQDREDWETDTTYPCYHPDTDTVLPALTQDEADALDLRLTHCAELSETRAWVQEHLTYEYDDEYYIEDESEHNGHVYIEGRDAWYEEGDCSILHSGDWAHDDDTVTLANGDRYLQDDDDIAFVDRTGEYYLRDELVITLDDEYELAEDCYELPNDGGYIHEDDLQRAG